MSLTRRQAIMVSLGTLVLTGCSSTSRTASSTRPVPSWPGHTARPTGTRHYTPVQAPTYHQTTNHTVVTPTRGGIATPTTPGLATLSRAKWTRTGPVKRKVNAMNGISKLTVHHEGWTAVNFTNQADSAARIEKIRKYHTGERKWGDIGYHYIIDRAGRVWEGRPIQYQGAHVSKNNEHNIGILVLGNFDKQSPSNAQVKALHSTAKTLAKQHKIKPALVRSHQEIRSSECPGKHLQKYMNGLRRHVA